ncbi:hypothetical protein D3273_22485 [Lichenibacterium minor]|uniref:DNA-binding protein n=1 Tax=Lichenibacterium minor TaxID=2316528 RepID=A0A4Q2U0V3_9HYPH|nr:hypothetical protein [Lichenibacterium minor]RYC29710.1 hypothetical protein D3273_22485 [Lichenibacterium minor]
MIPDNPETMLTRDAVAVALTASGYPVAAATLATLVSRGGGPIFRKFGSRALYRWSDALSWAQGRLSKPVRSSAELEAAFS